MKKTMLTIAVVLAVFCLFPVTAQQVSDPSGIILNHYASRTFLSGAIPKADLDSIIQAGIRAPSAGNRQPWHFTVVQDLDLAKKMIPLTVEGNLLIIVSASGDGKTNGIQILDCALATQSIYLQAQALGYASRIYTAPMENLNKTLKKELGLPEGYSAISLIRIGKSDTKADALSAASARNAAATMVTYK